MSKTSQVIFCALCVLGGLLAVYLAWIPITVSISHFIIEDMYYYLQAARNLNAGHVASLDGVHATNGFHPLWIFVICVLSLFPGADGNLPVHLALTLCAILFILNGWVLYLCLRKSRAAPLALPLTALFFCNYRMMTIPLGGLETGVAGLTVSLVTLFLLTHRPGWKSSLQLGVLLGLACLSRLDALLLAGIVLAWWCLDPIVRAWRHSSEADMGVEPVGQATDRKDASTPPVTSASPRVPWVSAFSFSVVAGVVCLAVLTPWFVFSWKTSHSLLPNSRVALETWRGYQWDSSSGYAENVTKLLKGRIGQSIEPLNDFGVLMGIWPVSPSESGKLRYGGVVVVALAFLALFVMVCQGFRMAGLQYMAWIPVYVLAHTAYYVMNAHILIRYFYPIFIPALVCIGACAGALLSSSSNPKCAVRWATSVVLVLILGTTLGGIDSFRKGHATIRYHPLHLGLYGGTAPWLRSNSPIEARVGGFNSGIVSFYSERRVVNLDGVMNDSVIPALKNKSLAAYLDQEGITYLTDIKEEIEKFMDHQGGDPDWRSRWEIVYSDVVPYNNGASHKNVAVMKRK